MIHDSFVVAAFIQAIEQKPTKCAKEYVTLRVADLAGLFLGDLGDLLFEIGTLLVGALRKHVATVSGRKA